LLVLAVGVVAVSWAAPLIRLAEDAPVLVIASLRLAISSPPMIAVALATRRGDFERLSRRELLLLTLAGVALAAHFGFWVASLQRTSVLASVALVTMQPVFVGIGAWLVFAEAPTRRVLIGGSIAIGGALVLAGLDLGDRGSLAGDGLAVLGAMMSGTYFVIGRGARARVSTATYGAVVYSVGALVLLALVAATGTSLGGYPREAYVYILLLAIVSQLIGHNAFNWALASIPAVLVAVVILGEPVGAALISTVVLDEVPGALEWLGAATVLVGVYAALRSPDEESVLAEEQGVTL
jgi:drug/metabolite transporter (DMT)-like permease